MRFRPLEPQGYHRRVWTPHLEFTYSVETTSPLASRLALLAVLRTVRFDSADTEHRTVLRLRCNWRKDDLHIAEVLCALPSWVCRLALGQPYWLEAKESEKKNVLAMHIPTNFHTWVLTTQALYGCTTVRKSVDKARRDRNLPPLQLKSFSEMDLY